MKEDESVGEDEYIPPHIKEYFDLVDQVGEWCKKRAVTGDVTIDTLARMFADNVVRLHGRKTH